MEITVSQNQGPVSISVMQLQGKLDGSNYKDFIAEAEKLYDSGARDLLLDMSNLTYMSSAGIAALHSVALLFRGQKPMAEEEGWSTYRSLDRDRDSGPQAHVKLLVLNGKIHETLDMVGYSTFFEIYNDIHQAVASFH
jgi:hypothetical protein